MILVRAQAYRRSLDHNTLYRHSYGLNLLGRRKCETRQRSQLTRRSCWTPGSLSRATQAWI
ncbi:hypothetical protein KSP40_PGU005616 [Platanthera guangdongensis]|uniref:Ribosomal protein S14 n=1 Tax=Platanthera guangdongensis TaxID=2320717 RepID=A0ABR2LL17_9ASPA